MKRNLIIAGAIIAVVLIAWFIWAKVAGTTKVALVNFPNYQVARMAKSLDTGFIDLKQLSIDDFDKLNRYDAILIFGMGIRMTDEHRAVLEKMKEKNVPVFSTAVTDPVNNISSLDSIQNKRVADYLTNGGSVNYRSLFNYIRKELTGKSAFTGEIKEPVEISSDVLFHLDDERVFDTVADFEKYYKEKGFYKEKAPKVALIVGMAGPFDTNKDHLDSLIVSLERRNMNVYPVSGFASRLKMLEEIDPAAVIYMPHGRLLMGQGEKAVEWLKAHNVPMFCPITINDTYDNWMADKRGMAGGFMSQSIVMPELDGGIVPFALNAQFIDDDGLYLFKNIPGRLAQFSDMVANYLRLQSLPNKDKKVVIYYYKGPGKNAMTAAGLEVLPSLYNFLKALKAEGYDLSALPATEKDFEALINEQGPVFNAYAEGNIQKYLNSGYPAWVSSPQYSTWLEDIFSPAMQDTLIHKYGRGLGDYYTREVDGIEQIAVTRIDLGNVVLLPQPTQGTGDNSFAAVHGSNEIPPHHYIASYLWVQKDFKADAMIHFGTHGSLEFIPGKQVALSSDDWTDRLVGSLPHFYLYTISDVGEGLIAKRRSYAATISHLTPPFIETGLRREVDDLLNDIKRYLATDLRDESLNLKIKNKAIGMGLHRDLQLDSIRTQAYSDTEIEKIENFAEELCAEKIVGGQYTLGVPYDESKIASSVKLMCTEPIAFSLANLDEVQKKVTRKQIENQAFFNDNYRTKAQLAVKRVMDNPAMADDPALLAQLGVSPVTVAKAQAIKKASEPKMNRMMAMMMAKMTEESKDGKKPKMGHGHPAGIPKTGKMPDAVKKMLASADTTAKSQHPIDGKSGATQQMDTVTREQLLFANAVLDIQDAIRNVNNYREYLRKSPQMELDGFINALNGHYVAPSPGGDVISDPNVLPTGRNLYGINAEATPTPAAWEKGKEMGNRLLAEHAKNHGGATPQKVSFTLWSGSFIESEGATIAEILYLLGVEPIRDQFNRVLDIRLIDVKDLGRPRVDVVVQTSGQLRDVAASRLTLIQKAVDMAAAAGDGEDNYVAKGRNDAERVLLDKGFSPKEAREYATQRVFGGANGMYGTGITSMVESGDRWENESEIANVYLNNMGATYGNEKDFGGFKPGIFEAALQNTEAVVQPRQSNTWGALSLDHVYEFMGGMSLTVRNVTGNDPDAYFNDLRNRHQARVQDLKSAIGVETRSTLFNPVYMKEQMKEGASAANAMSETIRNTYGWNVMKPKAIDNEIWDQYYEVFVNDKLNVGVKEFFERENPAALQEATAVMMETARKGYWKATPEQLKNIAALHSELVEKYDAGCSGFVCDNAKLRSFIGEQLPETSAKQYQGKIESARNESISDDGKSVVLKKDKTVQANEPMKPENMSSFSLALISFFWLAVIFLLIFFIRKRTRKTKKRK
ncbi:cobaltochelatase subunit CobN [Parabacteroides faecis]|uniref:cobaltochelatase subunit CobN n=1 Tax=Parabacteroides TaxID=375288 RepID=UPI001655433A|nr:MULTISPECIES: cobaltochelatase subunit CobN [Parabacteroides]MBC8618222.1 cobaltochelatase subunit CobN [Parabacteroides faecis]